jgi:hypothetical protein
VGVVFEIGFTTEDAEFAEIGGEGAFETWGSRESGGGIVGTRREGDGGALTRLRGRGGGVLRAEGFCFLHNCRAEVSGCDGIADWLRNHHGDEDAEYEHGEEQDHRAVGLTEAAEGFGAIGDKVPFAVEIVDAHGCSFRAG